MGVNKQHSYCCLLNYFLMIISSAAFKISFPPIFSLMQTTSTLSSNNTPHTLSLLASIVLILTVSPLPVIKVMSVSYTHLTLPTILLV